MAKLIFGVELEGKYFPYCKTEDGKWDIDNVLLFGDMSKESCVMSCALGVVKAVAMKAIAERFLNHTSRIVALLFDDDGVSKRYIVRFCVGAYDTKVDVVVDTRGGTYIDEAQAEKVY